MKTETTPSADHVESAGPKAYFDLKATKAFAAVELMRLAFSPVSLVVYLLILSPFILQFVQNENPRPLATAAIMLGYSLWVIKEFVRQKLAVNTGTPQNAGNIAELMSYHMVRHLSSKRPIDPANMLAAATESERGLFVLHQIGIGRKEIITRFASHRQKITLDECLAWGIEAREELKMEKIDSTAMIFAFFKHVDSLSELMNDADLSMDDLKRILQCEAFHFHVVSKQHEFGSQSLIRIFGGLGRDWVMGYANQLERMTSDLSPQVLSYPKYAVVHRQEQEEVLKSLRDGGHKNYLILGKAGSGKRTFVENLAYSLRKHELDNDLQLTRVLELKSAVLLSGVANRDSFLLSALEHAKKAGRFILFIPDLALLLKAADPALKEVLIRFMQVKNISIIGIAEPKDYHSIIKNEPLLDNLFEKAMLPDCTDPEAMLVLLELYFRLERRRKTRITYRALKSVIELSKRYIGRTGMPGKAVDVLKDAVVAASGDANRTVTEIHVREIVSEKAHMNVNKLSENERERLLMLEDALHKHVVGQRDAIHAVTSALKRARLEISDSNRPLGTYLFLGPTGVGKTETAKTLAKEYFGSEESFIRIDLNEYSTEESVTQIVGGRAANGEFLEGFLTRRAQDRPFSLILLDEIEKAHPHVLNVFLQLLDEGSLIDGNGVKTDFKNSIIIATSNAGALFIRDFLKASPDTNRALFKAALIDKVIKDRIFSPEFVNRFDEVVLFYPLSREEVTRMTIGMLDRLISDIREKKGIAVRIESNVLDILVEKGYSIEFGAREMRRKITEIIENYLADYMLKNTVRRGDEIVIRGGDLVMA